MQDILSRLASLIWSEYLLIPLLSFVGIFLTLRLRAFPWRYFPHALGILRQGPGRSDKGDIPPWQALMAALASTVGTGNIVGVATAIHLGGPGAIFWMWMIALFGMATQYAEAVLAVHYRETDRNGRYVGGPMYYIRNGLRARWGWLGGCFALFGMIAAFGIGNTVQANSVAELLQKSLAAPPWLSGLLLAIITASVIIGGITRIGRVAAALVPLMALVYLLGGMAVVLLHLEQLPAALGAILHDAFTGTSAGGGFAGATVAAAIRYGLARGIFSNEAGLGSTAIAHASAQTAEPVRQGMLAMIGTFVDTMVICTLTALAIIMTGSWNSGETGAALTASAFAAGLPVLGTHVVTVCLCLFALTTLLGWSYYGERCAQYLFGARIIAPYRLLWVGAIFVGALGDLEQVWTTADIMNGLMALPNLIALLLLSPVVVRLTRGYLAGAQPGTGKNNLSAQ